MDRISGSKRLQRNEQVKAFSNLANNGGLSFLVAGAGRWFIKGFDGHVMLWLLDGVAVISVGVMLLTRLEAET
ncbi:MAG: hypothetical protein QOJ91_2255 [Sphingomonadales bacterium]|jgi:hypothetical protein|nr:hypothetical protein [Sphingomonadales bacterium]